MLHTINLTQDRLNTWKKSYAKEEIKVILCNFFGEKETDRLNKEIPKQLNLGE